MNASEEPNIMSNEINSQENDKVSFYKHIINSHNILLVFNEFAIFQASEEICKVKRIMSTTKTEISDLKENMTYFLELMAHNAKGNSNPVNISVTILGKNNNHYRCN